MLGIAVFFALLAILVIGTLRYPAVAFAAVLCLYGLKQWGQDTSLFLVVHRTIANWSVAGLVAVGLLLGSRRAQQPVRQLPATWLFGIGLYVYAFVTLIWSPNLATALDQWGQEVPYVLLVAIGAPFLLHSTSDVKRVCDWTVFIGGAICAVALVFGQWGARGLLIIGDLTAQETDALAIAGLAGTVCVAATLSIPSAPWWKKLLYAAAVPIGLATILRSGSRGQLLATGVAVLIGWPLISSRRSFRTWITLAVVIVILNMVGTWMFQQLGVDSSRWTSAQSQEDVQGRLATALALLHYAFAGPGSLLFGLGNSSAFHYVGFYPHIAALEVVAEEGLIGTALYLGLVFSTWQSVWRTKTMIDASGGDKDVRYAHGVLTALFVFEFVLTLKQGSLLSSVYAIAYATLLGRMATWLQQPATSSAGQFASTVVPLTAQPFPNLMR